ncbi:MAG TPA: hypothetical protein PKI48_10365, partial [Chitinophagales bacterium]|nr:hypothetical protein [Chitinophagales bacterium]
MTDINLIKRNEQPTPLTHEQVDSNWQTIEDAVNELNNTIDNSRYIISGFPIWSGVGLKYLYPHINYVWNGVELTAPQGSITLDTSDVSFDRFDLIVLSENGTVSVIKGTASDNPIIPTLPNDRLLLLTINVKAGMTEPNVISEIIYNENSEWTTSILLKNHPNIPNDLGSIDFDSTNEVKVGAKSIHWNTNEKKIAIFKPASLVNPTDWTTLSMWIMLKEPINDGRRFEFQFYKTAGNAIGNYIDIRTKGLNQNLLNTWQLITIPIADFNIPNGEQIERLRATFTLGSPNVVRDLYIDYIRLTTDVEQVIEPPKEFNVSVNGQLIGAVESINFIEDENIEINGTLNDKTADISIKANIDIPNITLQPTFAGFKFINEDVYSIYIEGANFETSNLSDYNIGIGVEVHRANVLDACGNSQGVVFYYTLGDNLCEEGYSSGGEVCVPNFYSEDDMIDYIYYNNDSCIETIEWTGTQIGSKFINDFGANANVFISNCQKLTSVKLEYVTEMSDSHVYVSNPLLIEILTPLLASVGGYNVIESNTSLTTIEQPLLASVGGGNYIDSNNSLTTI